MACAMLIVQADNHTAAGAADDVLTLPADVGMRCSRIKHKRRVGPHNDPVPCCQQGCMLSSVRRNLKLDCLNSTRWHCVTV